jgi:signal transduction histidine kinase/ActR/RegA family two-component response regulator
MQLTTIKDNLLAGSSPHDKQRAKSLLQNLLLTLILVSITVFPLLAVTRSTHAVLNATLGLTTAGLLLGFMYLTHRGYVSLVSYLLAFLVLAVITFCVYSFGGVYSVSSSGYFLVIVIAAVLLNRWGVILFGASSVLSIVGLYYLEAQGYVVYAHPIQPNGADMLSLFTYLGLSGLLLCVAVQNMNRAHRMLHQQEQELIRTVKRLRRTTHAERKARATAQEAARAKAEFLANMSHEIRTPLNAIAGMTDLMLNTPLNFQQRQFMETIGTSNKALLAIISDILDFSKIEAGKLALENNPFVLREVVEEAVTLLQPRALEKGLRLNVSIAADAPPIVKGDDVRLRQVLVNLLGNAVKFTRQGEVTLLAEARAIENGEVTLQFAVRDTGIGIPQDKHHRLFHSFSQVDASNTREHGGTGLGLAICKRLVQIMGGEIWFESEEGQGSTFYVTLPFKMYDGANGTMEFSPFLTQSHDPGFDPQMGSRQPLRLLVAEDNPVNQMVALHFLRQFGYKADVAENGKEALVALQERPYDAVFMDVQMPTMDGIEATQRIHQIWREGSRPLIIAMTAHALEGDRERLLDLGMDLYLEKPIRPANMAQVLKTVGTKAGGFSGW